MLYKVTAIIPVYNASEYIGMAIDSVLNQTVACKVIVVNDASTDNTSEVLREYHEKYSDKLIVINKKNNEGVSAARNIAIEIADTEYIAFLDADDWWATNKIECQLKTLEKSDAIACYTGRELMSFDGKTLGKVVSVPEEIEYKKLLKGNVIPCSSVLIKRDVAIEYPMKHDEMHEDYIMWLSMLRDGKRFVGINQPMLKSRMSVGGKSRNKWISAKMTFQVYRYMRIPLYKAIIYFVFYVYNGIRKYS